MVEYLRLFDHILLKFIDTTNYTELTFHLFIDDSIFNHNLTYIQSINRGRIYKKKILKTKNKGGNDNMFNIHTTPIN